MESLWRQYDVIFEKLVKQQASSAKIHIFLELVSQIILFLADNSIFTNSTLFLICVKKQNIWTIAEKWYLICQKASVMLMTLSKQGKRLFFKSNSFIRQQHEW